MIPAACEGYGGQLFLVKGGQIDIVNRSLMAQASTVSFTEYRGIYDSDITSDPDYHKSVFGGKNSWFPGAYSNHKPMAFSPRGRMVMALNQIEDGVSTLYIGGWDGSGLFRHLGGGFEVFPWKAGVGWDALGPSGTHGVRTRDLAIINHNNAVFGIGHHVASDTNSVSSDWGPNKMGWTFDFDSTSELNGSEIRRTYRVFSIDENDKRIMGPVTRFLPNITEREHLNACDAFSFKNDLYYANWVDVLKFPGGSGTPEVLYFDNNNPRPRTFMAWPSGGFSSSEPVGENRLLMLEGDGIVYRLRTSTSGRNTLADLRTLKVDEDGRETDNFLTRVASVSLEPGRPPLMLPYNDELHAFVISATSGYMHFTCNGSPSGIGNWTNRTDQLPADLKGTDGCLYGFTDTFRNKIYVMHVAYAAFGVYGTQGGGQNSGGGYWLYQLKENRGWEEITRGMAGPPFRGLIPYQNLGPHASVPSGNNPQVFKCSDYAVMTYKLFDQEARTVNVEVEYSVDAGASWNTARRFKTYDTKELLGSGLSSLSTSPAPQGIEYTFFWDYVNDVGFDTDKDALLRVRPRLVR